MTFSPRSQLRRSAAPSAAQPTRSRFAPRPFTDETHTTEADSLSPDRTDAQPDVQARSPFPPVNMLTIPTFAPTPAVAPVQAKLTIGEPGDQYEQEADRTAAEVMRMPDPAPPVQRESLSEEEEALQTKPIAISSVNGASLQQKCSECEQDVQRSSKGTAEADSNIEGQLNSSKGGGSPLSDEVRSFMEPRFGADFSAVRTHTGGAAVQMSQAIGAQAFTHGSDIYFGAGKSPANSDLTAHELTHVVQQTGSNQPIQRKMGDDHDLTSPRFAGDEVLEACYDGEQGQYLRNGAKGEAVTKVQQALVELGYPLPKFGVDGSYGEETGAAVASFKQDSGITPSDPVVGTKTIAELDRRFQATQDTPPEIDNSPLECPEGTQFAVSSEKTDSAKFASNTSEGESCQITPPLNPRAWVTLLPRAKRDAKSAITVQKGKKEEPLNIPEPNSIQHPTGAAISEDAKQDIVNHIDEKRNDESIPDRVDPSNNPSKGLARVNDSRGFGFQYNGKDSSRRPEKLTEGSDRRTHINEVVWREIGGEGGASALNTYDSQILTWGKGFAASSGQLPIVLNKFCKKDPTVCEELLDAGISHRDEKGKRKWLVVNTDKKLVEEEDNALHLIQFNTNLLNLLIDMVERDEARMQNFVDAQFETVRENAGNVPDVVENNPNWGDRAIALTAHCIHAFSALGWQDYLSSPAKDGDPREIVRTYGHARKFKFGKNKKNGEIEPTTDRLKFFKILTDRGAKVISGDITSQQLITFAKENSKGKGLAKEVLGEPSPLSPEVLDPTADLNNHLFFEEARGSFNFYHLQP